jgi:DNA polymerase (family X)
MDKEEQIAAIFEEIAVLLELKGENPFKSRAYRNGARAIELLEQDLDTFIAEDRLGEIKGIGEALQQKITEFCQTGKLVYYEELKASLPAGLLDLLQIPGLGPKKAKVLYEKLKISDLVALEKACRAHRVAKLAGFGEKTEEKILAGIEQRRSFESQFRYGEILHIAEQRLEALRDHPDVVRCSLGGSLRRGKETTKDIDLLASSKKPETVMEMFVNLPGVMRVNNHGPTKSSVVLEGGVPCDLRVVSDKEYPYALHHFTGSKEHNVAMRQRAIAQKKKLSEWGLFREPGDKLIACRTEEEIFQDLGLQYIPPELREDLGEIEAAEKNQIPRLVEWTELRGTFHCHTNASDGKNNLAEMAGAAQGLGLEYLGIGDHSKSSFQANGLNEERLRKQIAHIAQLNKSLEDFHIFSGCEVDILKDGKLDFRDDLLAELDYVVASVHAVLTQPEEVMTRRVIRAMENRYVTMLGHPTGRLLLSREASAINMGKIIDCAAETGTWIELNANAWRLDMDWRWWHRARDKGVKCVINPDAHSIGQFDCLPLGVAMARKGWLRKKDVLNTLPLDKIRDALKQKRSA